MVIALRRSASGSRAAIMSRLLRLKIRTKELIPTVTYRCTRCGFLEIYARPV